MHPKFNFIIILDVFKENQYSKEKKSTQNAWLSLFTAESVDDLERLVAEYPWMEGICQDMALAEKDNTINEKDATIAKKEAEIDQF